MAACIQPKHAIGVSRSAPSDGGTDETQHHMTELEVLARCKVSYSPMSGRTAIAHDTTHVPIMQVDALVKVRRINMWGTGLRDISLMRRLVTVEVVSLSMNEINDITPLISCKAMTELYLRKNKLPLEQVAVISQLPALRILWLSDNPCARDRNYRSLCFLWGSNIAILDQVEVSREERETAERMLAKDELLKSAYEAGLALLQGCGAAAPVKLLNTPEVPRMASGDVSRSTTPRERKSADESDYLLEGASAPISSRSQTKGLGADPSKGIAVSNLQERSVRGILEIMQALDMGSLTRVMAEASRLLGRSKM
jgi:hypothetical protein